MTAQTTEQLHASAIGLDQRPLAEVAQILAQAQAEAAAMVAQASDELGQSAAQMARTVQAGGILHYAAAGSSGLMAAADAQELGGTFSIPATQLRIHMAGGLPTGVEMPGGTEDDVTQAQEALRDVTAKDTVIAVSASGATPFTLAAAKTARAHGAHVIAIANNPGARLFDLADHAIVLNTPPEVLSGSTRMGAGTAQKIALNMLSTMMAVQLGHVHDGMMVNVLADNIKLRNRASGIVQRIADVSDETARRALDTASGEVKAAVLIAAHDVSLADARAMLDQSNGHLRPALDRNEKTKN